MRKKWISFFAVVALLAVASFFAPKGNEENNDEAADSVSPVIWQAPENLAQPLSAEQMDYIAVWVSYLEWESVDFSTPESFTADISAMLTNCVNLGATHLIVQVRPFGDALYQSDIFPSSHLVTGTQGAPLPYDPLQILVTGAHAAGLQIEAWINPYRIRLNEQKPAQLSPENPAVLWQQNPATRHYVQEAAGGLYYDPGEPQVQQLILDGVAEILDGYAVDGIVFDDYFYPTTDAAFDAQSFAAYGDGLSLEEWRRQNVSTLVQSTYALVKSKNPACRFGISPTGNILNNFSVQYSDIVSWLSQPGYLDYLAPQLYWGFHYCTQAGSDAFAFENVLADWLALPRCDEVALYPVLGAYRIGAGDGSSRETEEWLCGENLARMVQAMQGKTRGFSLYRYDFLYNNTQYEALVTRELAALQLTLKNIKNEETEKTESIYENSKTAG